MSILDRLAVEDKHCSRVSDLGLSTLSLACTQVAPDSVGHMATPFEFELSGKLAVRFWANKAQYNDARKNAEKLLLIRLYGDLLQHISEAKRAVYSGSAEEILASLSAIEQEIGL